MSDTHLELDHSDLVRAMRDVNRPQDADPPIGLDGLLSCSHRVRLPRGG